MVVVGWLGTATVTTQDLTGSHDTTKSGDFLLATTGDHYLATSGDFFMATDNRIPWSRSLHSTVGRSRPRRFRRSRTGSFPAGYVDPVDPVDPVDV